MSQSEFHALTEEERRLHVTRILSPVQSDDENVKLSEDEEAGSDTEPAEAEWRSGEAEVNAARAAGVHVTKRRTSRVRVGGRGGAHRNGTCTS